MELEKKNMNWDKLLKQAEKDLKINENLRYTPIKYRNNYYDLTDDNFKKDMKDKNKNNKNKKLKKHFKKYKTNKGGK